jgi:hypothetical protein
MYCIFNFNAICFLKFIVHTTDSKMVKMTEREKSDVADTDVVMGWILYAGASCR